MVSKKTSYFLLLALMPSAFYCSLIPLKIGNFRRPMSQNDLGRGFKLNVAQGEDSFRRKIFDGSLEIQPMTSSKTISTIIKDYESLQESMEIGGRLAISYGPTISGEGSGNYLDKSISSTRQVTVIYRSRHTAFFKRLQPGTLTPTQEASDLIFQPRELADAFGTRFVDTIVHGAQLDVAFTVTSNEDIDLQEIEAELKGSIGNGALNIEFAAKFHRQEGQERETYNMNIVAEASGVQLTIPANPTFEQVDNIIKSFNEEYEEKFQNFEIENNPLLEQIEPVGFILSGTADRIETLNKYEVVALEDKMNDLGEVFRNTMYWKAKLNIVNRDLRDRYERNHKLRVEMYNPYALQREMVISALDDKRDECLSFRALPISVLVAPDTTVPDHYPKLGGKEEDIMRGLSGEHYIPDPVKFGNHEPLEGMHYIGFALKDGDRIIPWMSGCLKSELSNGAIKLVATADTPEELYRKAAPTPSPTLVSTPRPTHPPTRSPTRSPIHPPQSAQYKHIGKGCVNGQNLKFYAGKTVEKCATLCDARADCYGFEYGVAYGGSGNYKPNDCQLSSSSNTAGCNGGHYNLDFYKKESPVDQFKHIAKACVNGQNLKLYAGKTVEKCATLCDARADCHGFEYGVAYGGNGNYKPHDCQLSSSSNTAGCNGGHYNLDFYKKEHRKS